MKNMFFCFPKPKSISDLESNKAVYDRTRKPSDLRRSIQIAVVDDQPFAPETNLRNNQFQISVLKDVNNVDELRDYQIILCDLQGVGLQLSSDMQGAFLIEEVKRNFPEKSVIAFTGGSANSNISKRAYQAADDYLKKDASIDEWRDVLDRHIKNLSSPVNVWRQFRLRLVEAGITPYELMLLEDAYVKCIKDNPCETKSAIQKIVDNGSNAHVKSEVMAFVGSKAFDFLIAALTNYANS
jgi:hypothetical protein